ncbi:endonuclease/exonuclease/phosphatase family protein [Luteimonas sp. WGS1318]|uniref:endonuclease/exonuclease/phosphatase family protein n=1 Tax=Luteimonas sp. WGS1318 TaxID=3366815 RepID=UPI00372D7EAD
MRALVVVLAALWLSACASTSAAEAAPPRDLRVVTLNIYHDRADWPARLPLIVEQLRALDADVIALQEVLQTETLPNQAETLAAALGYHSQFVSLDAQDRARRYGNALLTRWPVEAHVSTALAPRADSRSMGWAQIRFDGQPINVYFTHLHAGQDGAAIRRQQLEDAVAWMARISGDAPSLVLGDFNAPAGAAELAVLDGFVDTYGARHPGATETTTLNPHFFPDLRGRIDLVFAERDRFEVRDARIVLDTPDAAGTWPSDHFGVYVELRPRPAPRAP